MQMHSGMQVAEPVAALRMKRQSAVVGNSPWLRGVAQDVSAMEARTDPPSTDAHTRIVPTSVCARLFLHDVTAALIPFVPLGA